MKIRPFGLGLVMRKVLASEGSTPASQLFIFALAPTFKDGEALVLRVGERKPERCVESGNDLAHRLFARRALRERLGGHGPVQRELAAAHLAAAFA